jgi:hypothetical protein
VYCRVRQSATGENGHGVQLHPTGITLRCEGIATPTYHDFTCFNTVSRQAVLPGGGASRDGGGADHDLRTGGGCSAAGPTVPTVRCRCMIGDPSAIMSAAACMASERPTATLVMTAHGGDRGASPGRLRHRVAVLMRIQQPTTSPRCNPSPIDA